MSEVRAKKRSLRANFIFNFISQILTLIIPIITTPYLARVLHETGNGQYSYSLSIVTYFILFANLGFDIYGQRQVAAVQDDKEAKSKLFWELFLLKSVFTVVSLAVLYGVAFSGAFGKTYTKLILLLSIQVIAVPFDIQFLFRGDEDFRSIAIQTIVLRLVGLACIFAFVRNETQTWVYALCLSVSVIASNLIMWPSIIKKISFFPIKLRSLRRHILPAVLIFLPTLAVTVYSVFDKTMIGLLSNNPDYENGCYEQAYKINSVSLLLVTIISSVMVSRNAHDFSEGNMDRVKQHLYSALSYVWMIGLPLIVGFVVLSKNLSSWFLGAGYDGVPRLLMIMSVRFLASGFSEIFGSQLFIAIGKEKFPLIANVIGAVVNVTLNYFLIPLYGAFGAAIATAACEVVLTLVYVIFVVKGKYLNLGRVLLLGWKYVIAATVMFVPLFFMQKFLGYSVWTFLLLTVTGMVVYALCLFLLRDKFFLRQFNHVLSVIKSKVFRRRKEDTADVVEKENSEIRQESDVDETGENHV